MKRIYDQLQFHRHAAAINSQIPVFACFLVILAASTVLLSRFGMPFPVSLIITNLDVYVKGFLLFIICDFSYLLYRNRPKSPTAFIWSRYSDKEMLDLFIARLPLLLLYIAFLPLFALLKPLIPLLNSYSWDPVLIQWDRAIFGTDPWRLLQPILGFPIVTAALAVIYHAWFGLVYPGALIFLYARRTEGVRRQYLLAFMLTWFVGGFLLASGMASVGPCFLEPITGDPRFSEQMAYLNAADEQIPVMVLQVQEMLLKTYLTHGPGAGAGITAMPSMHVAIAFLFWLAIRRVSRNAGRWFFALFLIIWIASVHLAYHYAVDGLISVILVAILWRVSHLVISRWDSRLASSAERPPVSADEHAHVPGRATIR